MDKHTQQARRLSGMAKFERTCRIITNAHGRRVKAHSVPGTVEAGKAAMLYCRTAEIAAELRKANK